VHQEGAAVLATVTVEKQEHPSLLAGMVWSWLPLTLATTTPTWLKEVLVTHPAPSPQPPRDALASALKRTELQHRPSSIPGREIVQVLTEIPVGVESGWHTHPGEEVGYIVAGTVEMAIHGRPTLTLHAGDGFLIPPRTPHNARDLGPGTGHMLSTYIVEAGQPLASLTGEPNDQ
jgi:quercetin dioxygenase-like cupin family protein